jgi:hypothetical protein
MHDEWEKERQGKAIEHLVFPSGKLALCSHAAVGKRAPGCSSHIEERELFLSREPLVLIESIVGEPTVGK